MQYTKGTVSQEFVVISSDEADGSNRQLSDTELVPMETTILEILNNIVVQETFHCRTLH